MHLSSLHERLFLGGLNYSFYKELIDSETQWICVGLQLLGDCFP